MLLTDADYTALHEKVSQYIAVDTPISANIATLTQEDLAFYRYAVKKFTRILQRIAQEYTQAQRSNDVKGPLVTLLEKDVPPELLPCIRREPPFLNFTRLDFQGRYIIEYNSAPGFHLLSSLTQRALEDLQLCRKYQIAGCSQIACTVDIAIWEKVLAPLTRSDSPKTIAILSRIAKDCSTRIYGELTHLAQYITQQTNVDVIFPCAYNNFAYKNRQLIHKETGQKVDVVYLAASEGYRFARWRPLVDKPLFNAYRDGGIELWPPPVNSLFTSKFLLAYLSDTTYDTDFRITPGERQFLNQVLPWTRILTPSVAQTARLMIKEGMKIVIKPGHGSGGRGVHILEKGSHNLSPIINKAAKCNNYICMQYAAPDTITEGLSQTVDAVIFLDDRNAHVKDDDIFYMSRIFRGEKLNLASEDAGVSPVVVRRQSH